MEYQITYQGKLDAAEVLANTPAARLHQVESVGAQSFNRLIQGDNLTVMQALRADPAVRGKVNLVYIDPPQEIRQYH